MKRKRLFLLAVLALAMAALVSLAVSRLMPGHSATAAPPTQVVVAAAKALNVGAQMQAEDLRLLRLPPAALPAHVYTSIKQLAGRVLTSPVVPNQVIVGEMVAQPGTGVGLPPLIPPGMRAVSVKVNDVVSVAGFALPGTHVDVLLTGNPRANSNPADVTTVTLLKNVQVLTAGQQLEQRTNGKPEQVTVITLLVSPEGAEKLAMADGFGHLQLALRNPLDRKTDKTLPLHNASLYYLPEARRRSGSGVVRTHADPPPRVWTVEMISGNQQQAVKFTAAGGR
ncbi:MAG: Flp pilus assembly protein CpaB [Acidobacteria bacterium]|nr:MAG: Flp pilus assembly protein CpaB [Acidobacteriota bacterium]